MQSVKLYEDQLEALKKMKDGCILCGDVGSGKSITALAYYYTQHGGVVNADSYVRMTGKPPDLYIITTAKKRDSKDWDLELARFHMYRSDEPSTMYGNKIFVDSWNNLHKYAGVSGAFFIFDEQRVIGKGAWVRAFLQIAKSNRWILLSATPGDTWLDYIPVFIANGFFKNRSEFYRNHCVFNRYTKYIQITRYLDEGRLIKMRRYLLVDIGYKRPTTQHHLDIYAEYDHKMYKYAGKTRWNPYTDAPMATASELCQVWRRIVNSDISRRTAFVDICTDHPRVIVFYNFDYELDILHETLEDCHIPYAEWNGHKHQKLPEGNRWAYLVQYLAGCEGWNCTTTDTMIFYSANYSYRVMTQAAGRIDRRGTLFKDLYYYHLKSRSGIDIAIDRALEGKKDFNERDFLRSGRIQMGSSQASPPS